ncbi:MAG TPA: NAD(+)/NADH kinase [Acidimicrobiia bacterium]
MFVGLVANPGSSKDIRRFTTLARVVDVEEKANIVARFLVGLGSEKGVEVLAVDDRSGLVRRAVALAGVAGAPVHYLPIEVRGTEGDTREAAIHLAEVGAAALVTVGGDGTVRAAAEGWPRAPLVPLAAGTNNAFALTEEPTVVGLAVALAVTRGSDAFTPTTAVEVETTKGWALAVIDAVVVRGRWVGSGAIWEPAELVEGLVTSSRRTAVGIASVSASFGPLEPGHARHLHFGGGRSVRAVFGPGLVLDIPVEDHEDLPLGAEVCLVEGAGMVALDGERRFPSRQGLVRVVEGPGVIDLERAFRVF